MIDGVYKLFKDGQYYAIIFWYFDTNVKVFFFLIIKPLVLPGFSAKIETDIGVNFCFRT